MADALKNTTQAKNRLALKELNQSMCNILGQESAHQ